MAEVQLNGELLYKGNDPISPTTDASTVYVTVNGQKIEIKTYIDNKIEEVSQTLLDELLEMIESEVNSAISDAIQSIINPTITSTVNTQVALAINDTLNSKINNAILQSNLDNSITSYVKDNVVSLVNASINDAVSEFIEADFNLGNDSKIKLFMTKLALLEQLGQDTFISKSDAEATFLRTTIAQETYLTISGFDTKLSDYTTTSELNTLLGDYCLINNLELQVTTTVNDTLVTAFDLDEDTTYDDIPGAITSKINSTVSSTANSTVKTTLETAFELEEGTTNIPEAISNTINTAVITSQVNNALNTAFGVTDSTWVSHLTKIKNFIDENASGTLDSLITTKVSTALSGDALKNLIDTRILANAPSSTSSTGITIDMLKNIKEELGFPRDLTTKIDTVILSKIVSDASTKDAISKLARFSVGLTNDPINGKLPKLNIAGDLITVTLVNPSEVSQVEQPALP